MRYPSIFIVAGLLCLLAGEGFGIWMSQSPEIPRLQKYARWQHPRHSEAPVSPGRDEVRENVAPALLDLVSS
jgi:hypothetical protein